MAVSIDKKFRFVSPGVFMDEVDNSQLPKTEQPIGPVIIGRTLRGPAMRPVEISSFSDFIEIFGNPVAGGGNGDVWREGNKIGPTYAAYAAQAWLKNSSKATIVRLLGDQSPDATVGTGSAGWKFGTATTLYLGNSGSQTSLFQAANFYLQNGYSFMLSGTLFGTSITSASVGQLFTANSDATLTGVITGSAYRFETKFNLDEDSDLFIRKVFNTNPILTNGDISNNAAGASIPVPYFLGESFEQFANTSLYQATGVFGLATGSLLSVSDHSNGSKKAATGWVFSQDFSTNSGSFSVDNLQKLFKFEDLGSGDSFQREFKISLLDIKAPTNKSNPYGTFTVAIRMIDDCDATMKIVEQFPGCNLNPISENYIAKKIGDQYLDWSDAEKSYTLKGNYPTNSKFIRVVMNDDVDAGSADPTCVPFGCYTVPTQKLALYSSGSFSNVSLVHASLPKRSQSTVGNLNSAKNAVWGTTYNKTSNLISAYKGVSDQLRATPAGVEYSDLASFNLSSFTLDDLRNTLHGITGTNADYLQGSRQNGTSFTATGNSYAAVLSAGWNRFTVPIYGGFDGLDVTESEPFRNSLLTGATESTNYAYYSILKALNMVSDPERVEMNLLAVPGITNTGVGDQMINVCESRADALAIVDLPDVFTPRSEGLTWGIGGNGSVGTSNLTGVLSALKARGLDTSYACTYYPWVRIRDTLNNSSLWAPPSIAALGVLSNTDKKSEPWFAPAGFTRGGLSEGAAGIPVIQVSEQLTSKQRDLLYEANVNPIAQFPAEGIVVFGQKTLQVTRSDLDRINVRRLMIFLKKEISRIAARLLFDPNTKVTWNAFLGQVNPLLASVQTRFGLQDYRVILDETTTTPDLVDQNIMYAKIFLKPTRTVEFIALDFVITNSGASFND